MLIQIFTFIKLSNNIIMRIADERQHNKLLVKGIIINKLMQKNIREEMNRYPVFSCGQVDTYIDESELFKDQEIKRCSVYNAPLERKNQTIVSIYDRIMTNNSNDPLHPQNKPPSKHHSSLCSARQSRREMMSNNKTISNSSQANTITKFVGELAKSLAKDDGKLDSTTDLNRKEKISLLKRIIDHYNIKSVEKKYYSNLIKTYGLRIQSVNSQDIAVKKSIHPRNSLKNGEDLRDFQTEKASTPIQNPETQDKRNNIYTIGKKTTAHKRFRPSNSFLLTKNKQIRNSRQQIYSSNKKRSTISTDKEVEQINTSCGSHKISNLGHKLRKSGDHATKLMQKPFKLHPCSNTIESKMKKYREFLFLINFSNKLYKPLEVDKYQTPFKVFIGRGNNRNLIKSVMKKRFWFEETNNPMQANFIWTQLKLEEFYTSQIPSQKQEEEYKMEQDLIFSSCNGDLPEKEELTTLEGSSNQMTSQTKLNFYQRRGIKIKNSERVTQGVKYSKLVGKAKDHAPIDPHLKILSRSDVRNYQVILDSLSFKKNQSFQDKLRVSPQILTIQNGIMPKMQNHLPSNGLLGNKKAMYYNLREYCRLTNKNLSDYVPLTFHIKKGLLDQEYKAMSAIFVERKRLKKPNYWIIKPGEFSNRGQGITCTNKLEDVKKRLLKCRDSKKSTKGFQVSKGSSLIVQQYISNPLLYNSRKFDIRMYMMVTICNGKLKGYWYQEGYIRTSSFVWSLLEIEDRYVHLTNDAVQKNCEQYGLYEPGNKLTFSEFQRYLSTLPKNGRNLDFFKIIYPRMRAIAADLIKSTFINLDPNKLRDNFEVFGLDFMIDETFRPWLIEANTNPCLEMSCPILERIIPHMVQNAFRIAVDPIFPPPTTINQNYKFAIPENALHYNKFQLIFDEDEEGQALRALYKGSKILEEIDQFEEDKEEFEEQGEIMELTEP